MIYLIWTILNLIIYLYFLYLIFGFITIGRRIFKTHFKFISMFIMIIGIVQIISPSNQDEKKNTIIINEKPDDIYNSKKNIIVLEDNMTMDFILSIKYYEDNDLFIPTASHTIISGFVGGFDWTFTSIQTSNYLPNEQVEYSVNGILKWKLFGINIYNEFKSFNGIVK